VPDNIYKRQSAGTNRLIAEGAAQLYLQPRQLLGEALSLPEAANGEEVLAALAKKESSGIATAAPVPAQRKSSPQAAHDSLPAPEREILALLIDAGVPRSPEELALHFTGEKKLFWETLAVMELEGKVENLPGGRMRTATAD
jgi:predicted Rossmann fold nucleotide-binding protein DprA/Smf involved in DNA uptake